MLMFGENEQRIKGVWGQLSSGKRIPLDTEAIEYSVKRGEAIPSEIFRQLPGLWIRNNKNKLLPYDREAIQIAQGLGWNHLLVDDNRPRLFFP